MRWKGHRPSTFARPQSKQRARTGKPTRLELRPHGEGYASQLEAVCAGSRAYSRDSALTLPPPNPYPPVLDLAAASMTDTGHMTPCLPTHRPRFGFLSGSRRPADAGTRLHLFHRRRIGHLHRSVVAPGFDTAFGRPTDGLRAPNASACKAFRTFDYCVCVRTRRLVFRLRVSGNSAQDSVRVASTPLL